MRPKQLYRSDDSAFTMLATTIGPGAAVDFLELTARHHTALIRRLDISAGDTQLGSCLIIGDVVSEILRIESTLAAALNHIADDRFTANELTPFPE